MIFTSTRKKYIIAVIAIFIIMILLSVTHMKENETIIYYADTPRASQTQEDLEFEHFEAVHDYFKQRRYWNLSNLGRYLYQNVPTPPPTEDEKKFKILIYKDGEFLERRHLYYFADQKHEPFEGCSVNNCELTYDDKDLQNVDAVMILLHRLPGVQDLPQGERPMDQRWILCTDESPYATFQYYTNKWEDYAGIFNWTMSYKSGSDIPVPYGRTIPLSNTKASIAQSDSLKNLVPNHEEKDKERNSGGVLIAAAMSNCGSSNYRLNYIKELMNYIDVDLYGGCADKEELRHGCPPSYTDCPALNKYSFFLAFENANCDEYMTEKVFYQSYEKGNIPIIMGPSPENCASLLPPNSYIHVEDFMGPEQLAEFVKLLNQSDSRIEEFHDWRRDFSAINEHGYMGNPSVHYCRACEALNFNDKGQKVYETEDLRKILSSENCLPGGEGKTWGGK